MKPFRTLLLASLLPLMAGAAVEELPLITEQEFLAVGPMMDAIRMRGVVSDAFMDDVDPQFMYLILSCGQLNVPVSVVLSEKDPNELLKLVGREVEVRGDIRSTSAIVSRAFLGRMICVKGAENILPVGNDTDPFTAPELIVPEYVRPALLPQLGQRRTRGRVIAVWGGTEALIQPEQGRPIRLSLPMGTPLPSYGAVIEAVGHVETDSFNLYLTHARWRSGEATAVPERIIHPTTISELFRVNATGEYSFHPKFNGQTIRLSGVVRGLSGIDQGKFLIEDGDRHITVDASSLPAAVMEGITRGCVVEVTGTFVLATDRWRENDIFPRVRGILLIPNEPKDIRITATAPWLTPVRAWIIVGVFALSTLVIFLWNRILWFKAFRRGRALSAEILARAEADMRTRERTRLAVELHDSLVQSLSGVIMELETAKRSLPEGAEDGAHHLMRAEKTLRSCHTDLRNCLWDLRSEALEEHDMTAAIKRTLLPHVKDVALDVRFNVARARLTDNTAYTILRIVRELTLNGIKHGGANHIKIAGKIEDNVLHISVRDNGSGYNPVTAPGIMEGHFGLEGIRERVRNLSGSFDISAQAQGGTRAVITIPVPQEANV